MGAVPIKQYSKMNSFCMMAYHNQGKASRLIIHIIQSGQFHQFFNTDIAANPAKVYFNGTVILSTYTAETGYLTRSPGWCCIFIR